MADQRVKAGFEPRGETVEATSGRRAAAAPPRCAGRLDAKAVAVARRAGGLPAGAPVLRMSALLLAAAIASPLAEAAVSTAASQAQGRYERDRAACLAGQSSEDRATCLKEAQAARAAALQGELNEPPVPADNAVARCKVFTGADRQTCEARLGPAATTSGSVAGGGILRELVQTVPAASAPAR